MHFVASRRRRRKLFLLSMLRMAGLAALVLSTGLLVTSSTRALGAWLTRGRKLSGSGKTGSVELTAARYMLLAEKRQGRTLQQIIEEDESVTTTEEKLSAQSLLDRVTSHRLTRRKRSDQNELEPTGVALNHIEDDTLVPWKNAELDGLLDAGLLARNSAAPTVSLSPEGDWSRSSEYEQVMSFCVASVANSSTLLNDSSEAAGTKENQEHDACAKEKQGGFPALWTILYILIVLFLFIALAIICDDFFVPSLEAISERLNLSEDVAGATFMAAGSSAPELFTSVAGVGTGSDVGVGTIVGSAVFNLLVIIALTAALSGRILQIDWRPLARDSIFYGGSVMVFIFFSWDGKFTWWESLLLLLLYVAYIVTMKFNKKLMDFLARPTCCFPVPEGKVSPSHQAGPSISVDEPPRNEDGNQNSRNEAVIVRKADTNNTIVQSKESNNVAMENREESTCARSCRYCCCCCCCCRRICPCVSASTATKSYQTNLDAATTKMMEERYKDDNSQDPILCEDCTDAQYLEEDFAEVGIESGKTASGLRTSKTIENGVKCRTCAKRDVQNRPPSYESIGFANEGRCKRTCSVDFSLNGRKTSSINVFRRNSKRYRGSYRKSSSASTGLNGTIQNGDMKVDEIQFSEDPDKCLVKSPPQEEQATAGTSSATGGVTLGVPRDVTASNGTVLTLDKPEEEQEDESETLMVFPCLPPIKHSPPEKPDSSHCIPSTKYIGNYFIYILSFPWICAFTWTIPDCSKPDNRKWYLLSFFISIAWIAVISYVMVEVVDLIGCLMGIDPYTMGLMVIAVGTSVPDAMSSILVAREGYGDMAVSNAIGSNVFDINLGIGLPFLLRSAITMEPVYLLSPLQGCLLQNLTLSVRIVPHVKFGLILLLILLMCLLLFAFARFRLNKTIGAIFVSIYVMFMIYAIVQEKSCYAFYC